MFVFKRPSKKSSLKIFSLQIKLANFQLDTKELSIKDKSIFLFEKKKWKRRNEKEKLSFIV